MLKSGKPSNMKMQGTRRVVRKSMLIVFMSIAFIFVFLAKPDSSFVERAGGFAMNIVSPVVAAAKWPFTKISDFYRDIAYFKKIDIENEKLIEENKMLRATLAELQARSHEVELAAKACRYSEALQWRPITAKVAGGGSSSFSRSFVLNAGENLG